MQCSEAIPNRRSIVSAVQWNVVPPDQHFSLKGGRSNWNIILYPLHQWEVHPVFQARMFRVDPESEIMNTGMLKRERAGEFCLSMASIFYLKLFAEGDLLDVAVGFVTMIINFKKVKISACISKFKVGQQRGQVIRI